MDFFFIKPKTRHFASYGIKTFKSSLKFIQPLMGSVTFKHYCSCILKKAILIIINIRQLFFLTMTTLMGRFFNCICR